MAYSRYCKWLSVSVYVHKFNKLLTIEKTTRFFTASLYICFISTVEVPQCISLQRHNPLTKHLG